MYSIKINKTGRYVTYCDESWYETTDVEVRLFEESDIERVKRQMRKHYVYDLTVYNNGVEVKTEEPDAPAPEKNDEDFVHTEL